MAPRGNPYLDTLPGAGFTAPAAEPGVAAVVPAGPVAAAGAETPPLSPHLVVVDDFLPASLADDARACIDRHFATPYKTTPETHQVWDYWHVPGLYTYLRTTPEKLIAPPLMQAVMAALTDWCHLRLGPMQVGHPLLSLYVSGCRQALHNDSENGRFAFVYSLTRNERRTTGGETLVMKEDQAAHRHRANAGSGLYDLVEPAFNRLVVFDDRALHAVQMLEGSLDPQQGRFVLHGHITESGLLVEGGVDADAAREAVTPLLRGALALAAADGNIFHGPLSLRVEVAADGAVTRVARLVDRVLTTGGADPRRARALAGRVLAAALRLRLPAAGERGSVTMAVMFRPG